MLSVLFVTTYCIALFYLNTVTCDFEMVILHTSDMHGRFEETERNAGMCKPENEKKTCVGGFARIAHEVRAFRRFHKEGQEVLFLNAGDTYMGSLLFSLFRGYISRELINVLRPDTVVCRAI